MLHYPKVIAVYALPEKKLRVLFDNDERRIYNCQSLIEEEPFSILKEDAFFYCVKPDAGGYGIYWNESIDLSESELWLNGQSEQF